MSNIENPIGSVWHRWDPHIHTPDTLLANNFKGEEVFAQYIKLINESVPPIRALGITDYYSLDSYQKILKLHEEGKFTNLEFLFPNVELRFAINSGKGKPINVHFLINPKDRKHIEKSRRFLNDLKFNYKGEKYGCTKEELIRLGKSFSTHDVDEHQALKKGVEQCKISPQALTDTLKDHKWARENILIGIAANQKDGLSQLQEEGLKALREELQRTAHFIFSGRPGDRDYWCGKGADDKKFIINEYRSLKPCLHGSDAHELEKVGNPDENRYCWIKGDLNFETLKQICFEPEHRVFVGKDVPNVNQPSQVITQIDASNSSWLKTSSMKINSGLVAIIGARGSGKTALVELLAAGSNSVDKKHTNNSFLERAKEYLIDGVSGVTWGNNEKTSSTTHVSELPTEFEDPRVRYLSQQFVDQLCSSDGLADELISEIERVIYDAHPSDKRMGARSFDELRSVHTEAVERRMVNQRELLKTIGNDLSILNDLRRNLEELTNKRKIEYNAIERLKKDRKLITPSKNITLLNRLEQVRTAAELKSNVIAAAERKQLKLNGLKEEAKQFCENGSEIELAQLKSEYQETELTKEQWDEFSLVYKGDIDLVIAAELALVEDKIIINTGPSKNESLELADKIKSPPYFEEEADMNGITHSLLLKEQRRLEASIGMSDARNKQYNELSNKIVRAEASLAQTDKEIAASSAAPKQIEILLAQRQKTYASLINEFQKKADLLKMLYGPLQDRLDLKIGTLGKLTFSVNRDVDIESWAEAGERLIDKSRSGAFKGVGSLTQIIKDELGAIWSQGKPEEIAEAMSKFRNTYSDDFWKHAFEDALNNRDSKKDWFDKVVSWLYSTNHVQINYGLQYEGVDIQQLSPGTRGIVLLLLYLSIDIDDERPLIIDQPEENLDPESIYLELVDQFKQAKSRRQIIIVTHNANLVVNTDADQVIIASRGKHKPGNLPDISYTSGGLENQAIRTAVCNILEGGETAFLERSKRLRIPLVE
ncbi:hypothetical protein LCGC14_0771260 [marine sediment metagenome]|uniref:ATPase AAA-type core domain-containing protein n=1 Tax=marine sediment metagenome TaxID=412755 RepID=A0A0F9Q2D2_9ZZZZ